MQTDYVHVTQESLTVAILAILMQTDQTVAIRTIVEQTDYVHVIHRSLTVAIRAIDMQTDYVQVRN